MRTRACSEVIYIIIIIMCELVNCTEYYVTMPDVHVRVSRAWMLPTTKAEKVGALALGVVDIHFIVAAIASSQ